jgi:hypothetical protein
MPANSAQPRYDCPTASAKIRENAVRVVPFYNYLQAAYVIYEDGRLPPESLLRVASEMVTLHRFDGDALARSYADLGKRGHLTGAKIDAVVAALPTFDAQASGPAKEEVRRMVERLPPQAALAREHWKPLEEQPMPDYLGLVGRHNPRDKKKKKK